MKKIYLPLIFIIGLIIFLYPIVSNIVMTTIHQKAINNYHKIVSQSSKETIEEEKEKITEYNEELSSSDLNYVDPFTESNKENETNNTGMRSYYDVLNLGPSIGIIRIPKINVELPIYHGSTENVLSRGAGHLENSSLPTSKLGSHTVITAHRGLPSATMFRNLDELEIGDQFFIEVLDEIIAYEVESIKIVDPSDIDWLKMERNQNKATLLTCHPYMINSQRLLVTGKKVTYEPSKDEKVETNYENYTYVIGLLVLLSIIILFYLFRRKKRKRDGK